MQIIPVEPGVPFQDFSYRLEDKDYQLVLRWNFRREVWSLNILDSDSIQIYSITSLLLGTYPGILSTHNVDSPLGSFAIIDTSGQNIEASLTSINTTHLLVFLTSDEILDLA